MTIRDARAADLDSILTLLQEWRLPAEGVREHLGAFLVLEEAGEILGAVGLEIYGRRALLRSLAVTGRARGKGGGAALCEAILARARARGITEVVLLTETAEGFFAHRGFESVPRDDVDAAVKESVEFRSACPASATCMRLRFA